MATATRARRPKAPAMTAAEATSFERTSRGSIQILRACLHCNCSPYQDVFTYKRWQAQGYQVKRGEHGIRLPLVKYKVEEDDNGDFVEERRIFGSSRVFCRCQVEAISS